eukprot:PhM_4_TR16897/c0_g1_i1/m.12045
MSASASSDNGWMVESMVQFMHCPEWVAPVQQFIDTHCIIFDTEDESKHEFLDLHKQFKALCEQLLEGFLGELGIPLDTFVAVAAEVSRNPTNAQGHAATQILEYIMAIDDFLSFKHMMEKRNVMLELEVMEELQAQAGNPDAAERGPTQAELDEEEELRMAIEASLAEFEAVQNKANELDEAELQQALKLSEEIAKVPPPPENIPPQKKPASTPPPPPAPQAEPVQSKHAPKPRPELDEPKQRALAALSSTRGGGFGQRSILPSIPHHEGTAPSAPSSTATKTATTASTATPVKSTSEGMSADDIAKRAAYMRAQKERIVQQKNKQRQEELSAYMEEQGKKLAQDTAESKVTPEEAEAMRKRLAVAQRFREDLVQVTRQARENEQ